MPTNSELEPLAEVLSEEIRAVHGLRLAPTTGTPRAGDIALSLDPDRGPGYALRVHDHVDVSGADYAGVAAGTVTLLQAMGVGPGLPRMSIDDAPRMPFSGVMIDCARRAQSVETLRRVVQLCRFYKVRHLQLHLTDDEAFTFPSRRHPAAATPQRRYTWRQLKELERFAAVRGVAIVPELDVPGHAAALISAMPDVFGTPRGCDGGSLVHMGREAAYTALEDMVGEMCAIFRTSPWFHIGGDEADVSDRDFDDEAVGYMRDHGLCDAGDLYRHFVGRMHDIVRGQGKRTLMWEGFRRGGRVEVPRDVVVMAWDTRFHRPDELLEDGYEVVNASWQPLYIVGRSCEDGAARMWPPEHIHGWHPHRWEHWERSAPSYGGLEVPRDARVLGAQMCVWELEEADVLPALRARLPAFADRVWGSEDRCDVAGFARRWQSVDAMLESI